MTFTGQETVLCLNFLNVQNDVLELQNNGCFGGVLKTASHFAKNKEGKGKRSELEEKVEPKNETADSK